MNVVLVDTSVWINFFKARETEASLFLKNNQGNIIIATCPTILQEVLQGVITDADDQIVKLYFDYLTRLVEDPYNIAEEAADLYRTLRKKGITIKKPNDCLIASYAMKNEVALLHDDKDFRLIAKYSSLKTMNFY